jgi:PAS domain S-box-containing protein
MKKNDKMKEQRITETIEACRHLTQMEKSETGYKLAEAEELYKTLAESSFAAVFIVQEGKFSFINTSAIAYAGYSAEEFIGQDSSFIVHPEDREKVKRLSREMLSGTRNAAFEFRMVTKQNNIRWISQTVTPIQYGGKPAILGNALDVTDLKQAEEALRESERLQSIILGSPFPTFAIGRDHEVMHWNKAMEELSGIKAEAAIGTIHDCLKCALWQRATLHGVSSVRRDYRSDSPVLFRKVCQVRFDGYGV